MLLMYQTGCLASVIVLGCQLDWMKRCLTQTSKCTHVSVCQRGLACLTVTRLKEGTETSPECGGALNGLAVAQPPE